jgi:hypothetical protein
MDKAAIDIAETLARLSASTIFELRGEWRRLHRAPPPMRLSRDLLMRGITYKLRASFLLPIFSKTCEPAQTGQNACEAATAWPHSGRRLRNRREALARRVNLPGEIAKAERHDCASWRDLATRALCHSCKASASRDKILAWQLSGECRV